MIVALTSAALAAWLIGAGVGLGSTRLMFLRLSSALSALGGAAAVACGAVVAAEGRPTTVVRVVAGAGGDPVGTLGLRVTPLAAVFLVLLGLVALAVAAYAPRYHPPAAGTALYLCAYNLALAASAVVLLASNVTTFLVAWESMTLFSGLVVLRHSRRPEVLRGAFLFLGLGEIGFAMVVAAFVIMATHAHSMDLSTIAATAASVPLGWRSAAFVLALLGFGFKAGLVPLHVWLPAAHPVAPADGSAFLSGLVTNLGVYGIFLFGFVLLGRGPAWWGLVAMALGSISAVAGVLYALMERDLKRFLAFSTVENIGVVVAAGGAGLTFDAYGQRLLGALLLIAALYHVVNHGAAKTLLFLEAGVIERVGGTRDLDRLGGLVHRMRVSAVVALIGTLAMAALPPLNGFVSEWLVFQGLFQGFRIPSHLVGMLLVLAAATLALTAGLAGLAFARAYGIAFLGMPRSPGAAQGNEEGQPRLGPSVLAVACVALALGAPLVLVALSKVARAVTGVNIRPVLLVGNLTVIPAHTNFSAFSPTYLAVFLVAVCAVPVAIYWLGRPRGATRRVPVWDGGIVSYKPRMQYTATTYANPVRVTFDRVYRPDVHVDRASDDPAGRSGPVHYRTEIWPVFERLLYHPVAAAVRRLSAILQPIQSGDVNLYLLYILVAVVVAYFVAR